MRDEVDALPEMKRLREEPSLCHPSAYPPRTSQDDIDPLSSGGKLSSPDGPKHTVMDSFWSLASDDTPKKGQQSSVRSGQHPDTPQPMPDDSAHASSSHAAFDSQIRGHAR